jgi:hypothetical protein
MWVRVNFGLSRGRSVRAAARVFGTFALAATIAAAHATTGWTTFGGNAQHTGVSTTAAQPLSAVRWSTPLDLAPSGNLIHYGSPVITPANTVIIPVRTGARDAYRLDARKGLDGSLLWSAETDYVPPPHSWTPSYSPALAAGGRIWYAGAGGTVHFRDNLDASVASNSGRVAFYGLAAYQSDRSSFDAAVFVNTPITADANGNIYFGFRTTEDATLGLKSGIARVDAAGNGTWVPGFAISGDAAASLVPHQAAPTLSNDGNTLYVVVAGTGTAYLAGLDPATLAVRAASPGVPMRVALKDPRAAGGDAFVSDNSSASPMVGPDGDVYYGVLGNPFNGSRGWLLHYSPDLRTTKTPGAFGWDNTAAVVPAGAVPSYSGSSSYLVFSKYNDYAGFDGGSGVNRIAVLDPNATMIEPHASSNGLLVMNVVLAIAGPTPDPEQAQQFPGAVVEWCINAAAVDPITKAVFANSEDGKVYRWDLATNTLSQAVTLSPGAFEAYTSTQIGPDGTVYATNSAILNAVGSFAVTVNVAHAGSATGTVSSSPGGIACGPTCSAQFAAGAAITLDATPASGSVFTGWLGACTGRESCVLPAATDHIVSATFAPGSIGPLSFDVDRNAGYDALTDGLVALRYLFGVTGEPLTAAALGSGATRTDPEEMLGHLNDIRPLFDIDGNGQADALTDGLLLIRYLFGVTGPPLTAGAIGPGAKRMLPGEIEAYIRPLLPSP